MQSIVKLAPIGIVSKVQFNFEVSAPGKQDYPVPCQEIPLFAIILLFNIRRNWMKFDTPFWKGLVSKIVRGLLYNIANQGVTQSVIK